MLVADGHGHVRPRDDGVKMRCGGPGICNECSREAAMLAAATPKAVLDLDGPIVCSASRANRTITFHLREGFANGRCPAGRKLADPDFDRKLFNMMLDSSIDHIIKPDPNGYDPSEWRFVSNRGRRRQQHEEPR